MPAVWLVFPTCILAGWYVTLLAPSDQYGLDATAKATAALPIVAAYCAACSAWEGARIRRAGLWTTPLVRSRAEVVAGAVAPAFLGGLLAIGVAVAVQTTRSDAGLPDVRLLAITTLDLFMYVIAGFAAGLLLPYPVAGPLSVVVPLVWLTFVPALYPVWLRHLTGMFRDCCPLPWELDGGAVVASAVVNLGLLGAAMLLMAGMPSVKRVASAGVSVMLAAVVAVPLVSSMPYAPAVPRDESMLECGSVEAVTICVWPEHRDLADATAAIAADVSAGWRSAGLDTPTVFTEADASVVGKDTVPFNIRQGYGRQDVIASMAAGLLPSIPDCAGGYTGGIAFEYLHAWYAAEGGIGEEWLRQHYSSDAEPFADVLTVVEQLRAATDEDRRNWVARAEKISQACDEWPLELIAVRP